MSEKEEKECDFLESYSYEMNDETIECTLCEHSIVMNKNIPPGSFCKKSCRAVCLLWETKHLDEKCFASAI